MATITVLSRWTTEKLHISRQDLLPQIERVEKKNFARHEAFDFDIELKKRNMELVVILDDGNDSSSSGAPVVAAYLVFTHFKPGNVTTLHKICVQEMFRRQSIAKKALVLQIDRLKKRGCSKIQLWVNEDNSPAVCLYTDVGFEEISKVESYYAPGQTGLQMAYLFS
ncbi:hypothetical protein MMC28_001523 [Mycoblastus sanguinarius]|nr:hypothetical protein [Mycoblastus sanguinarius]